MSNAVKCPVCNGHGKVKEVSRDSTTSTNDEKTCHGCNGAGWVVVP